MATASIARVLLDSLLPQLDRLFDYRIPPALAGSAVPGVRVKVPLRSAGRVAEGFIVECVSSIDYDGVLSEVDSVVSDVPVLVPEVYALARRAADRAAGNASDILRLAIPKRQVRVEKAWLAAHDSDDAESGAQKSVVESFDPVEVAGYAIGPLDEALAAGSRLAVEAIPRVVEVGGQFVGHWAVTLAALATRALVRGSVILSVPDFRDQQQLEIALGAVLPASRTLRLDARQSNPERYRAFLDCLDDVPRVIIGNRSVVYAPAAKLAMIGIWDDGDPLSAEPLSPYVHSRDAALIRQEQQACALVLLSHSRSTEVERLVDIGWAQSIAPAKRVKPRVIPTAYQDASDPLAAQARIPSAAWREARSALEHGPVLIQVARPGYAPQLVCESCGRLARCARCDGPLGLRAAGATPSCRLCGALAGNWSCVGCSHHRTRMVGQGATRTAEDLGRAFPGVPVIIADGERSILQVPDKPALVIATRGAEPIAAGGYRAILLLDGERMLARESLRVAEDCARSWSNAIALAAEGAPCVLVGVGGELAAQLAGWRLADFARDELADRRQLRFPPAVRVATLSGDAASVAKAIELLPGVSDSASASIDVLGPVGVEAGTVRAIVRFDYAHGVAVAGALRAEVIRNATSRRKRVPVGSRPPALPKLRVRFDDPQPFDQF